MNGSAPPVRPSFWSSSSNSYPNYVDEKARRDDGILPSPASASGRSVLSSVIASVKRALASGTSALSGSKAGSPSASSSTSTDQRLQASWPAWSTVRFVLLCGIWYSSSALSSNTGKVILNAYRYPVTLTIVQFFFVAVYSTICCQPIFGMSKMRAPTKAIFRSTLPMAAFQVGGHVFSSVAISRIPVSTVHTIKALSPLFTVAAYAALFGVKYSAKTYISLLPLVAGVMLACSFDVSASNVTGLLSAFGSALVFVSSNIVFKKVMPSTPAGATGTSPSPQKLDKINLLLYSSSLAFLMMIPIWMYTDLPIFLSTGPIPQSTKSSQHSVALYYFLNGTVHFGQNIIAFIILASTSPVTYSIASLIKRVAVICMAIIWFNQKVHGLQGFGILLTFVGLYMYNQAKGDVERGENKMRKVEAQNNLMLPVSQRDADIYRGASPQPRYASEVEKLGLAAGHSSAIPGVVPAPRQLSVSNGYSHGHHPASRHSTLPPLQLGELDARGKPLSKGSGGAPQRRPTGSYPSPPPSVDSPPTSPPGRHQVHHPHNAPTSAVSDQLSPGVAVGFRNRRATVDEAGFAPAGTGSEPPTSAQTNGPARR